MYSFRLERRYLFTGQLALDTALHIGGGHASLSPSVSPIVRTPEGTPFIPGSSFKGVFRSTVEKIGGSIPVVRTCALIDGSDCLTVSSPEQRAEFDKRRRDEGWNDAKLMDELHAALCDTCHLFGSPYAASHMLFSDLHAISADDALTQIRDGVGIDRDRECAVPRIKYDFEVLEHNVNFDVRLILENPSDRDLQLACVGLAEFMTGFVTLGGKRSRGLGRCVLNNLVVHELDLSDPRTGVDRLRAYLRGTPERPEDNMTRNPDARDFLDVTIQRRGQGGEDGRRRHF